MNSTTSSSSRNATVSPYAGDLFNLGMAESKATLPILQQLSTQIQAALRTGGLGAQQPIINTAQDAARSAFSQSQTQTAEGLAKANVGGSEAQQILGGQRMAGGAQINAIPSDIASNFIGMAPGIGTSNVGGGNIAAAMGGNTTSYGYNRGTSTPGFWDMFQSGLGSFAGGAGSQVGASGWSPFSQTSGPQSFADIPAWLWSFMPGPGGS